MILLTVDDDPAVIAHTLDVLRGVGGNHEVHTASNLAVAENSASNLDRLDVLIAPLDSTSGDDFVGLRDRLRERFPKLHVLFLSDDGDASEAGTRHGDDPVLARPPSAEDLVAWANSIGLGTLPDLPHSPRPNPRSEQLLDASPDGTHRGEIPLAAPEQGDIAPDEDLPVAELVRQPVERLGDYKLVRVIASHEQTETHEAVQLSIGRTVALVLLKPEYCGDTEAVREFRGAVRAKAAVTHPYITPVYEAHEADGAIFYTRELVEGLNLPQLAGTGKKLNQRALLQIVKVTSECIRFMETSGVKHNDVEPRHIYLGQDAQVRVNNIATLSARNRSNPQRDIAKLAAALRPLVSEKESENHLVLPLLDEMESQQLRDWESLNARAAELAHIAEGSQSYSVSARTKFRSKVSRRTMAAAAGAAVAVAAVAALFLLPRFNTPQPIAASAVMVPIPAGDFIYQDATASIVKPFWIDKYEVTIGQYAEFLAALAESPTDKYDHPEQRAKAPGKSGHTPEDWAEYYPAAQRGDMFRGAPIDVNCPVMLVDWWDAYAYARWKGRRLPTDEEWSKAARGESGNLFPWGDELGVDDYKKFNSSDPNGDRFAKWCPVDAMPEDVSEFGVVGTAGNVSEWTASWDTHPEFFDRTVPIVRGGNFASPEERYPLTDRRHADSASDRSTVIGFRTVTNTDPEIGGAAAE